jgi:predicted N-acetyltransferase YhbS
MNIRAQLLNFFGVLGQFLSVLFREALQKELVIVVPLAREIVAQVAFDPTLLSSSAKRNAAIAVIITKLAAQQLTIGQDVIRLAIELAYQDFKISPPVPVTSAS